MEEESCGSISVQVLSQIGTVFVDELAEIRLCGFALAFDRLAKASTFNFNARTAFQRFPARCRRAPCCSSP